MLWVGLVLGSEQNFLRGSVPPAFLLFFYLVDQLELPVASLLLDILFPQLRHQLWLFSCLLRSSVFDRLLFPQHRTHSISRDEIREFTPWVPKVLYRIKTIFIRDLSPWVPEVCYRVVLGVFDSNNPKLFSGYFPCQQLLFHSLCFATQERCKQFGPQSFPVHGKIFGSCHLMEVAE